MIPVFGAAGADLADSTSNNYCKMLSLLYFSNYWNAVDKTPNYYINSNTYLIISNLKHLKDKIIVIKHLIYVVDNTL